MQIIRSQNAGFCMGVALALTKLDKLTKESTLVATYGPIIHNPHVLEKYAKMGVACILHHSEAQPGSHVLIRAHGIPKEMEAKLQMRSDIFITDATCPRVKDAQNSITKATKNGEFLVLFGEAKHPEVEGLVSYAMNGYMVANDYEEILDYLKKNKKKELVLAVQTTQDKIAFDLLKKNIKYLELNNVVILNTICDATNARQSEALEIAKKVDIMIVVGGKNSGNTRRLAEIVSVNNLPTLLIESADELKELFFKEAQTVGLTAGASTPRELVDEVEIRIKTW